MCLYEVGVYLVEAHGETYLLPYKSLTEGEGYVKDVMGP